MQFTGLNRFVKAPIHSLRLRGALTSISSISSVFSCAGFLSVRHSKVSQLYWYMVLAAPPVTKCARYLTVWWSITELGVPSEACKRIESGRTPRFRAYFQLVNRAL